MQDPTMSGQHEDKSFGSTEEEAQTSNQNKIHYSPGNDDQQPESGAIAAQESGASDNPNQEAPTGQGFSTNQSQTTGGTPGAATDRGDGSIGNNAYGTGLGETDLGSNSGLDEENTNSSVAGDAGSDLAAGDYGQSAEPRQGF